MRLPVFAFVLGKGDAAMKYADVVPFVFQKVFQAVQSL